MSKRPGQGPRFRIYPAQTIAVDSSFLSVDINFHPAYPKTEQRRFFAQRELDTYHCHVCGRKALYRDFAKGACRTHKGTLRSRR